MTYEKKYDIFKGRSTYYEQKQKEIKGIVPEKSFRVDITRDPGKGKRFYSSLKETADTHQYGQAVEVKDLQFYTNPKTKLFISPDASIGVAITPRG